MQALAAGPEQRRVATSRHKHPVCQGSHGSGSYARIRAPPADIRMSECVLTTTYVFMYVTVLLAGSAGAPVPKLSRRAAPATSRDHAMRPSSLSARCTTHLHSPSIPGSLHVAKVRAQHAVDGIGRRPQATDVPRCCPAPPSALPRTSRRGPSPLPAPGSPRPTTTPRCAGAPELTSADT